MNAPSTALVAGDPERWPLAGDQLYVDFDLSDEHLPPGTRLAVGSAVIEVTDDPHTGCKKFSTRFGLEALQFVNSPEGRALNLRGINTRVVEPGTVRVGDAIRRL
jgi:MOSC domain-containing protein YiiM